jgi:hypothetical protein
VRHPATLAGFFYTYLHRRKDTGQVFYVGKGRGRRAYIISGRSDYWGKVRSKCGHTIEIVSPWPTEKEAFEHEVFLISVFKSLGHPLVNFTEGGGGALGAIASPETRAKMVAAQARLRSDAGFAARRREALLQAKRSPEGRANASAAAAIHRRTDAARKKQSQDTAAAWGDPARAAAMKNAMLERHKDPDVKLKWSKASKIKLQKSGAREKIIANLLGANAKNSVRVERMDTGDVFQSINDAARTLGITRSRVRDACRRRSGKTGEFTLRFVDAQREPLPPDSVPPSGL